MPSPIIPAHVATGELITSAWGNGVVDSLQFAPVQRGHAWLPSTALVSGSTILHTAVPSVPYASRMFVWAIGRAGSDSGTMDGATVMVQTQQAGANGASPLGLTSPASRFGTAVLNWSWLVPANSSPQFSLSVSWAATSGGTTYVQAEHIWMMFRE